MRRLSLWVTVGTADTPEQIASGLISWGMGVGVAVDSMAPSVARQQQVGWVVWVVVCTVVCPIMIPLRPPIEALKATLRT